MPNMLRYLSSDWLQSLLCQNCITNTNMMVLDEAGKGPKRMKHFFLHMTRKKMNSMREAGLHYSLKLKTNVYYFLAAGIIWNGRVPNSLWSNAKILYVVQIVLWLINSSVMV